MQAVVRCLLAVQLFCLLSAVSSVKIAPWIPGPDDATDPAVTRGLGAESRLALAAAVKKVPAVVSEGFQRFFMGRNAENGTDDDGAAAYESQCLVDFAELMTIPGENLFGVPKGYEALDAMGKPGSDLLYGSFVFVTGSFGECLNIGERVKFWSAPITAYILLTPLPNPQTIPIGMKYGMCVPVSCDGTDFQYFINETNTLALTYQLPLVIRGDSSDILETTSFETPLTTGAKVMIAVCSIFLALAVIGSVMDVGVKVLKELSNRLSASSINHNPAETAPLLGHTAERKFTHRSHRVFSAFRNPLEFITAFSVFKNVEIILSTKQPPTAITSLNGIRVISMSWVILCHTFLWCYGVSANPLYTVYSIAPRFSAQPIVNGYFSVDSFFFLSGTLVAYLTLREMERKKGRFPVITYYLHRYLRLTMVYAFVLFFWWTLTVYLGNGPEWYTLTGKGSVNYENCNKYWWTNLLYINNFYPWELKNECMGWTWYLANDMQFFILAPLVLIPLYFFFPIGLAIAAIMLGATLATNGAIAGSQHFLANTNLPDPSNEFESNDIYVKPYCRAAPYIVGIVLGFLLFKKVRVRIHWILDIAIYAVMWVIAAGCCFSVVYGLYNSYNGHELTEAQNVSYITLSRFTWGVGLALIVFACHNGYGWIINDFLSMKFWIPLSRLSYAAYLVHPIVLSVAIYTTRSTVSYTDNLIAVYGVAMVVLSYAVAGVVAVFVEFPLSNLEMAVFKVIGLKPRESVRQTAASVKDRVSPARNPPEDTKS